MMRTVLLTLLIALFALPAQALTIKQARVGTHPDKNRLVFDLSELQNYRVFILDSPYRLVVDFPTFDWKAGGIETTGDTGIKGIRHGQLKPGISRIVMDLDRPFEIQDVFTIAKNQNLPDRLVIDYRATSQNNFNIAKNTIFGKLSIEDTAPTLAFSGPDPVPAPSVIAKPLIIIDPGHGGVDPGAVGANKTYEKHVVLKIARELKNQLLSSGNYRVMMTRESDIFIRLRDRVKFARQHGGDLFVSIHADSIDKPNVEGASIYTLSDKASDAQTAKLAARENKADLIAGIDLTVEDEDVANILVDLARRDTMNQSKFFAEKLSKVFRQQGVKTLKTTHRSAGFAVLKAPDIPSILVEAGFMSSPQEATRLNTESYRKKIAHSIKNGIDAYFEQVRKNERI